MMRGGTIKVSADGNLIQSSLVAQMVPATFADGHGGTLEQRIAGSYIEFAERRVLPAFQHLRLISLAASIAVMGLMRATLMASSRVPTLIRHASRRASGSLRLLWLCASPHH